MILRNSLFFSALTLLMASIAAGADLPNYSGSWTLDGAKSAGLPPGMKQTMSIVQEGDTIKVDTKVIMPQGTSAVHDTYQVGEKGVSFAAQFPLLSQPKGKRWVSKSAGGLEVKEEISGNDSRFQNKPTTVTTTREWTLGSDGTLSITLAGVTKSSDGKFKFSSKRVFVKKS